MREIPLIDLRRQNSALEKEIDMAVHNIIESSKFILGPEIEKFEDRFGRFCNAKHCISLSNGTDALELALKSFGIKEGDEVITVPHTFIANAEVIINVGAKPVFCDIDEETFTLDANQLRKSMTKNTKAIMPVDLYGHPCDLDPIMELAEEKNLKVVEDSCQAHGAEYKGKRIGGKAHATAFSFYPGKNLGAFGDAGALTTNDEEIVPKIRAIRNHGRLQNEKYNHEFIGGNYRMDELQAAILNIKLNHLEDWVNARRSIAAKYNELISSHVQLPAEASFAKHAYHQYVIMADNREKLRSYLKSMGISTGIHYPLPLHLQPALKFLGYKKGDFKISEKCADSVLSLPIYPELQNEEIEFVSNAINKFFDAA